MTQNKIPLLFLAGLLCDAEVFQHQTEHLSAIANIEIPDLNHSDTPEKMVTAALKNAPKNFLVAGHSMGGWVALEIMKQYPERILGLALLNTTALPDSSEKLNAREAMIEKARLGNYSDIIDRMISLFVYNPNPIPKIRKMFERNQSAFIHQQKAMINRGDCLKILEKILCPTLVLHAEKDQNFQLSESELMHQKIKKSNLVIVKNSGHMSPMESPEIVTQHLLKWIHNFL